MTREELETIIESTTLETTSTTVHKDQLRKTLTAVLDYVDEQIAAVTPPEEAE